MKKNNAKEDDIELIEKLAWVTFGVALIMLILL